MEEVDGGDFLRKTKSILGPWASSSCLLPLVASSELFLQFLL